MTLYQLSSDKKSSMQLGFETLCSSGPKMVVEDAIPKKELVYDIPRKNAD